MIELKWKDKIVYLEHEDVRLAWIRIRDAEQELVSKPLEEQLAVYDTMVNAFNEAHRLMIDVVTRSAQVSAFIWPQIRFADYGIVEFVIDFLLDG